MATLIRPAFALLGLFALFAGARTVHARSPLDADPGTKAMPARLVIEVELTSGAVESVELDREKAGLELRITPSGHGRFERLTRGLISRRLAIDVGSTRMSCPVVQMPMRTTLFIDGGLDELSPVDMRDRRALIESPLPGSRLRPERGRPHG